MVKLPKQYHLVSTKRYHFGSFTYTGVGDKISETVSISEKRLVASVFLPKCYSFVPFSKRFKTFKGAGAGAGSQKFRNSDRFGSSKRHNRLGS